MSGFDLRKGGMAPHRASCSVLKGSFGDVAMFPFMNMLSEGLEDETFLDRTGERDMVLVARGDCVVKKWRIIRQRYVVQLAERMSLSFGSRNTKISPIWEISSVVRDVGIFMNPRLRCRIKGKTRQRFLRILIATTMQWYSTKGRPIGCAGTASTTW